MSPRVKVLAYDCQLILKKVVCSREQIATVRPASSAFQRKTGRRSLRFAGFRQIGHRGSLMSKSRIHLCNRQQRLEQNSFAKNGRTYSVQKTCPHGTLLALFAFSRHNGHSYCFVVPPAAPIPFAPSLTRLPALAPTFAPFGTSIVFKGHDCG